MHGRTSSAVPLAPLPHVRASYAHTTSYATDGWRWGFRLRHLRPGRPAAVGCFGNSIYAGACGEPVCAVLKSNYLAAGYAQVSHARSGETADQIAHRIQSEAATACFGVPCGVWAVEGGVNSLKLADFGADALPAVVANYALNGDDHEVLGMLDAVDWLHIVYPRSKVLLSGVLPYAGCDSATCPILIDPGPRARAYNTAMLAACAARPWLTCTSPYEDFEDPDNPDHLKPMLACPDGIHLLTSGHNQLAATAYGATLWR